MSQKGSVLIYAMILAFFGTIAAVLLYTKSETLITQSALSTIEMKSSKNLTARADLAIKFATAVNSDGGGFRDTLLCPSLVTLTNTSSGTIVFATGSTPEYGYQGVSCIARDSQYGESVLSYTASGSAFSGTNFYGLSLPLSQNGGNIETPIFTGSGGFSYRLSFPVVSAYSGLDLDGDSDDLRPSSTGSVVYPGGKVDNDSLGRQVIYGYIKRGVGESLVFWNNDRMARSISANPNNTGSLALL